MRLRTEAGFAQRARAPRALAVVVVMAVVMAAGGVIAADLPALPADDASAEEINSVALKYAEGGQLDTAERLFARAVELAPSRSDLVNNLGVTRMRLGRFDDALAHFQAALALDPGNADATANLRDLTKYLESVQKKKMSKSKKPASGANPAALEPAPASDAPATLEDALATLERPKAPTPAELAASLDPARFQHIVRPLPVVDFSRLDLPENIAFLTGQRPYLVRNATHHSSWLHVESSAGRMLPDASSSSSSSSSSLSSSSSSSAAASASHGGLPGSSWRDWSLDYFATHFGSAMVDAYPHNMEEETVTPYFMRMDEAIREMRTPSGRWPRSRKHPFSTYIQWNMRRSQWRALLAQLGRVPDAFRVDDLWLDACLPSEALQDEFFLATHWRMLLIGNVGAGMFNHWDILRTSSWQFQAKGRKKWHICSPAQQRFMYRAGDVNTFDPDYDKFPLFAEADCFLDAVLEGDFVSYPKDYWHQTENLDTPTISISASIVDLNNAEAVFKELQRECRGESNRITRMSKELCEGLDRCFAWWENGLTGVLAGDNRTEIATKDFSGTTFVASPEATCARRPAKRQQLAP